MGQATRLLGILVIRPHPSVAMPRINIEHQDQFGRWHHLQTLNNEGNAYRTARARAQSTGKRHRLVDEEGRLLDLLEP